MKPINCDVKIQNTEAVEQKLKASSQQNSGKLKQYVVKPIKAAHDGNILLGLLAIPLIAVAATVGFCALAALTALGIALALTPTVLIGVGIYLACTDGPPLAVAGLIAGGAFLGMIGFGGTCASCR